ncbi:MAG: hypothetical protein NZ108_03870, partial [Bacteroidia bacterium]|nr:hypothetical protein [Bacteroidia bacterium]
EIKNNKFQFNNPQLVLLQIFSLCLFPFVAKNLTMSLLNISETEYRQLIDDNKQFLSVWLAQSLLTK